MDDKKFFSDAMESGRMIGHAEAVIAIYKVLDQYRGGEYHAEFMALMAAIEAVQNLK